MQIAHRHSLNNVSYDIWDHDNRRHDKDEVLCTTSWMADFDTRWTFAPPVRCVPNKGKLGNIRDGPQMHVYIVRLVRCSSVPASTSVLHPISALRSSGEVYRFHDACVPQRWAALRCCTWT
jgi:hypothetical protein